MLHRTAALALLAVAATAFAPPLAAVDYRSILIDGDTGYTSRTYLWTVPGLVTVDFQFPNTEHNVRELTALPAEPFSGGWQEMTGTLVDRNRDDPFSGVLRWAEMDFATSHGSVEELFCTGTCRLPIPRAAAGQVFVLAGFRFSTQNNGDIRIAEIGVRPNPALGYVDVDFADASRNKVYYAAIAWAYVPATNVASSGHHSSLSSVGNPYFSGTRRVLQGFRLAFVDGDRPLRRFSIDLDQGVRVRLIDQDSAERIAWAVDWVVLRD